ncbi:hypothetical protein ACWCQL_09755 [Streptomyces sp. NPDC002073]
MSASRSIALIVSAAAAGACLGLAPAALPQAAAATVPAASAPLALPGVTTWEYATVPLPTDTTKQILDQWGGRRLGTRPGAPEPRRPGAARGHLEEGYGVAREAPHSGPGGHAAQGVQMPSSPAARATKAGWGLTADVTEQDALLHLAAGRRVGIG